MHRLVALSAFLVVISAAPAPSGVVYSAPVFTPGEPVVVPHVVPHVVSPAVTSYSSFSNSVVHGAPVVSVPLVRQAFVHQSPVFHTVPVPYPDEVIVVN